MGVVGGGALTRDFAPSFHPLNQNEPSFYSASNSYIIGPSLEYAITRSFAIEVDALNRILHATSNAVRPDGSFWATSTYPVVTWEFPILAKYRLPMRGPVQAFLEGGPSLRTAGNLNGTDPSDYGATAGAGFELAAGRWRIAPRLRYTRWAKDYESSSTTKSDQVEVLVGFSHVSRSDARPFGRRLSFGLLAGTTLTKDYVERSYLVEYGPGGPIFPEGGPVIYRIRSDKRSLLIGPTAEVKLPAHFSVEAGALYRTLRSTSDFFPADGGAPFSCCDNDESSHIWEIPVLVKYELDIAGWKPFVGAGPAFRTLGASEDPRYGATAAAGLRTGWRRLILTPQVRYTRWASDRPAALPENQVQVLVGFSF